MNHRYVSHRIHLLSVLAFHLLLGVYYAQCSIKICLSDVTIFVSLYFLFYVHNAALTRLTLRCFLDEKMLVYSHTSIAVIRAFSSAAAVSTIILSAGS